MNSFVIAGTGTGVGKTTIATGLLAGIRARGVPVQGFKVGPDYIDPSYHRLASGRPSRNLDPWLCGIPAVRACYALAATDVNVIEGMMGLFDGGPDGRGSTAAVARALGLGVILVIDAQGLAQSAGAMVHGYATYDPSVKLAGVIFNRVAGEGHYAYLRRTAGPLCLGWVENEPGLALPERHLGLVPAAERPFDPGSLAEGVLRRISLDRLLERTRVPRPPRPPIRQKKPRATIAYARDEAFSFHYQDNLDLLEAAGARVVPFSPLRGELPSDADALYLGGGFPELHAGRRHRPLVEAVRAGMPVYAECGGLMYLVEQGLIPGRIEMTQRLQNFGYARARAVRDSVITRRGQLVRGHEFHYSRWLHPRVSPAWRLPRGPEGFARGNIHASYLHLHFGGAPGCARRFVESARRWKETPR